MLAATVYSNNGNLPLLDLIHGSPQRILDVGCGAGDNARILRARYPSARIVGITRSGDEAKSAKNGMNACLVNDLEAGVPLEIKDGQLDILIFSHVLEHL